MKDLFDIDGNFFNLLTKIYELLLINTCILLFSLPIFTIGSVVVTSYELFIGNINKEYDITAENFYIFFKKNFSKSTKIFVINIIFIIVIALIINSTPSTLLLLFLLALSFIILFFLNIYPILARIKVSRKNTTKLSILIVMRYVYVPITSFILIVSSLLFLIFIPRLFIIWLFLGFSLPLYVSSFLYSNIFNKFNNIEIGDTQ